MTSMIRITTLLLLLSACADDVEPTDVDTDIDTDTDVDTDTDTDVDTDTDTPPGPCAPAPGATGAVVRVQPGDDLAAVLQGLQTGETAELAAGTYALPQDRYIQLKTDGVTIRGATGDASDVVLDGDWTAAFGLSIQASDVLVTDLTIARVYYHPVHVTPAAGRSIENVRLHRIRVVDGLEQAIKINTAAGGTLFADAGAVTCSHLELTEAGRPRVRNNCYTGGIDAHQAQGWVVSDNHIEGFWCPSGLSEHGVHFWRGGRDTLVERNTLVNNARGIGFGLGRDELGRRYEDGPCGSRIAQSYDETAINNMIFADDPALFASNSGFDVGIALESACGATVLHNTVVSTQPPYSSLEYRFPLTSGVVANNLVSHNIRDRGVDGPMTLEGNLDEAPASWFVDAAAGELHLVAGAGAIDAGAIAYTVPEDMDGEARDASPDVGADEHR